MKKKDVIMAIDKLNVHLLVQKTSKILFYWSFDMCA